VRMAGPDCSPMIGGYGVRYKSAAQYSEAEAEFGQIAAGFMADLVLLEASPLDDISNTRTRVGVMKRGRWFPASEFEAALEQLAEARR
jgi:hypothetical protein